MAYELNGEPVDITKAIEHQGTRYDPPHNPHTLEAIGVKEVADTQEQTEDAGQEPNDDQEQHTGTGEAESTGGNGEPVGDSVVTDTEVTEPSGDGSTEVVAATTDEDTQGPVTEAESTE